MLQLHGVGKAKAGKVFGQVVSELDANTTAIVTYAGRNNQEFIDMAVMLGVSLTRHLPTYLKIALGVKGMTDENKAVLKRAGWHVVLVGDWAVPEKSFNGCGDSCIDSEFLARHLDSFEKLNAFRLPVGRVLYMDADTYVASDALGFLLNSSHFVPSNRIGMALNACERGFSSGVMLFEPSLEAYKRLMVETAQVLAGNATKRTGEEIINSVFEGKITMLDSKFNCMSSPGLKGADCLDSSPDWPTAKRCEEVVVSHFTGLPKPAKADVEFLNRVRGDAPSAQRSGQNHDVLPAFYCDLVDNQALLTRTLQRQLFSVDGCCHSPPDEDDPPDCREAQEQCSDHILMANSELRGKWFGVYNRTEIAPDPVFNKGRPIYIGPHGYFLYYVMAKGNWLVGTDYKKELAEGYSHKSSRCPEDATDWQHYSPKTKKWAHSTTKFIALFPGLNVSRIDAAWRSVAKPFVVQPEDEAL
jgi:hypothetical protein